MLFNSYEFWVFLAAVLLLYRALPHRSQNRMLLVASYVFYGFWDWRFLSLIFISTFVAYWTALGMRRASSQPSRRRFVLLALLINLGILGVFKYYDFFAGQLATFGELTLIRNKSEATRPRAECPGFVGFSPGCLQARRSAAPFVPQVVRALRAG